ITYFIPAKKIIRGKELIQVLTYKIFRLYSMPAKIIINYKLVFIKGFWSKFIYYL
ncbi:hypothetical protein P170DRAFT_359165, partial [Aspergillus steynii IBT 23096]